MQKKDGLVLFTAIREDMGYENIPLILVTSISEVNKVKIAIKQGVKPF